MNLLKQQKRRKETEEERRKKKEIAYYKSFLSEEQETLTGMDKFKEALKICEKEMQKRDEEERNRLGEKAYQKKKKREMKKMLREERWLDFVEKKESIQENLSDSWYRFSRTKPQKAAILVCSMVGVLIMGTTTIALRSPLADFVTQMFDKSSLLKMNDFYYENENEPQDIETFYSPTYIPDGYELIEENIREGSYSLLYKNENKPGKKLVIYQNFIKHYNEIDTETINYETTEQNGIKYYYLEYSNLTLKETSTVIWFDSQYQFQIIGDFSLEELLKIADSMDKIK